MVKKYDITFFDLDIGAPSATIAEYGVSLNVAASKFISEWKYGKLGYDKARKLIVIHVHNDDLRSDGSFLISDKVTNNGYIRINSRDLVRTVSQYCEVSLTPSFRCLAEWDPDENYLVIDLKKVLDTSKTSDQNTQ